MKNIPFLVLFLIILGKIHGQTSAIQQKDIFEQFKIALVGTWYSEGQGAALRQDGVIFDTVLYNSLPFKAHDKIAFYENGVFKVNDSKTVKHYEIVTTTVTSIDSEVGELWTFQIKLDGFDYYANFSFSDKNSLSLTYNYGTGSWSQPLKRK